MSINPGDVRSAWRDQELAAQYREVICLRAKVARLLDRPYALWAGRRRIKIGGGFLASRGQRRCTPARRR